MSVDPLPPEAASAIRASLEIDLHTELIRGTVNRRGARPSPFVGWLGLAAAIAALRKGADPSEEAPR